MTQRKIRLGIIGATGYVGMELCRLLLRHPNFELTTLCSRSYAGQHFSAIYPAFRGLLDRELKPADPALLAASCDAVITALPHGVSSAFVPDLLARKLVVLDHSGDFRFKNIDTYHAAYQLIHPCGELCAEAVYGLPELRREALPGARLIANPGCYPTASILAILPLLEGDMADLSTPLIIDACSGTSGAGRQDKAAYSLAEMGRNFKPYGVSGHRHQPEIEEKLSCFKKAPVSVIFTPHLLPIGRGMLATVYVNPSPAAREWLEDKPEGLVAFYREFYRNDPFIRILPSGSLPETANVAGSNYCDIGLCYDRPGGIIKVFSAIDNLGKGACSQAIQALNIRYGLPEDTGLTGIGELL